MRCLGRSGICVNRSAQARQWTLSAVELHALTADAKKRSVEESKGAELTLRAAQPRERGRPASEGLCVIVVLFVRSCAVGIGST
jgi:hypothetical protein